LQEHRDAWQMRGMSITATSQIAQLPAIKQARPKYQDNHSQALQAVLTGLDRALQAFFRRVKALEAPMVPVTSPLAAHTSCRCRSVDTRNRYAGAILLDE
jgi:hypothetical protein